MKNGKKRTNTRDKQRAEAAAAMPEVKKIVAQYGRAAVANCLNKIRERDKEMKKLEELKRELAQREAALR